MNTEVNVATNKTPLPVPAFFLIFLGALFLANNLGFVSWAVWGQIWKFWPLFLILAGFQILFGTSRLGKVALLVIIIALLMAITYFAITPVGNFNGNWVNQDWPC